MRLNYWGGGKKDQWILQLCWKQLYVYVQLRKCCTYMYNSWTMCDGEMKSLQVTNVCFCEYFFSLDFIPPSTCLFVFDKAVLQVSNETWKLNWNINYRKHLFLHFLELYAVCLRSVFFFVFFKYLRHPLGGSAAPYLWFDLRLVPVLCTTALCDAVYWLEYW